MLCCIRTCNGFIWTSTCTVYACRQYMYTASSLFQSMKCMMTVNAIQSSAPTKRGAFSGGGGGGGVYIFIYFVLFCFLLVFRL